MKRRLSILLHWLRGNRNGVGKFELLRFLASPPCKYKARKVITSLKVANGNYVVELRGTTQPLVWPKAIDLYWLYMVLAEQYYPRDWHYYETPETRVLPGDVVLDCGASEGLFTFRAASRAKRVFAIDPLPLWVDCMRQTFRDYDNVEIIP